MDIIWKQVLDAESYVRKTLANEADDIPQESINQAPWVLANLHMSKIEVNAKMIIDHDQDPLHVARKNNFIEMINNGAEILPLIVLGKNNYLVDGYARFRALKELEISDIQVFKQSFE